MNEKYKNLSLTFFAFSVFCLTILPRLLSYGMFFDGVTYASIARNMAEGYGSFWQPYYTDFIYPQFYEHPPFGFFLQSLAFRLFGDSLLIEAFWGFGCGIIILFLLSGISKHNEGNHGNWIPQLMFALFPMTSWLLSNNMLEGTMTVFTTFAGFFAIGSLSSPQKRSFSILSILSGIIIFFSVLIKGPVGLFPFCIPAVWLLTIERKMFTKAILSIGLMISGFAIPVLIFALSDSGLLQFFHRYYSQQLVASLSGSREVASSHFGVVFVILQEIIVPVIIGLLIFLIVRFKWKVKNSWIPTNYFWFYLLIAFSASLPILLSPKQMMWYVFPSFPFYALAVAEYFEKSFYSLQSVLMETKRYYKTVWIAASFIFVGSLIWMFSEQGVLRKQNNFHHDFSLQPVSILTRQIISVYPPELKYDWALVANMQRQFKSSLSDSIGYGYLLTTIDHQSHIDSLKTYKRLHPNEPTTYILYKKSGN